MHRQLGLRFDEAFDLARLAYPVAKATREGPEMVKPDDLKTENDPDAPWAACWDHLAPDEL